jgi:succinate dehydrogenase / fumarate reductase cytochrome b subunit
MALTGLYLFAWILGHMAGNLKAFQGEEKFDAYAEFLRTVGEPIFATGQLLWINRILLLLAVGLHILAAVRLALQARAARPVSYRRPVHLEDTYASRTMRWGGVILFVFVIYHLLHLTVGTLHQSFEHGAPYHNLVTGFQFPLVALVYAIAITALGFHLYHGIRSGLQTLGVNHHKINPVRRAVSAVFAVVIVVGFLSVPIGVLAGVIA